MPKKVNSDVLETKIALQKLIVAEGMNSSEAKALFASVTDLYEEIQDFEQEAPGAAINALTPHLKNVKDVLEMIMQNPMSYVSTPQKTAQKVTLKPVK